VDVLVVVVVTCHLSWYQIFQRKFVVTTIIPETDF